MLPTREEAEKLLAEGELCNPGPWGNHSRVAAHCAQAIAQACGDLDGEKAYILGLLHDIGRKFGVRHLGHVSDGYRYLLSLGYGEAARVCLTHSFVSHALDDYVGKFDTTPQELALIEETLAQTEFDDYDRLIQLCDALAGSEGVLDMEERMADVARRYGCYPEEKRQNTRALRAYFQQKTGRDIYQVVDKDGFQLRESPV